MHDRSTGLPRPAREPCITAVALAKAVGGAGGLRFFSPKKLYWWHAALEYFESTQMG